MANRLKMVLVETILTLLGQGWSQRRIARELEVHRETVARYARQQAPPDSKPAIPLTGSEDSKPAIPHTGSSVERLRAASGDDLPAAAIHAFSALSDAWALADNFHSGEWSAPPALRRRSNLAAARR